MKKPKLLHVIINTLCCIIFLFHTAGAQNIAGIGAQLFLDTAGGHTMPRIMSLIPNSPAYQYLNATDYIIKVNDVSCKDKSIEEIVGMIRGEVGTHVKITVADTKDGKNPKEHDLVRVGMQVANNNQPPPDPLTTFYDHGDKEAAQLKAKRFTIIKTFNATCGNRYFNFEASTGQYHVLVLTLLAKDAGTALHNTVRAFDNDDEAGAITFKPETIAEEGQMNIARSAGDITFKKGCIGAVNVSSHDDAGKCNAIYVIVYR